MGDALIARTRNSQSLNSMNIMIDSCHAYDFASNLYKYLQSKGVAEMPVITTETNRGQVGYTLTPNDEVAQKSGIYSEQLYNLKLSKPGKGPLLLNHVFKADRSTMQDGAVFIPSSAGITALGSSHDEEYLPGTKRQKGGNRIGTDETQKTPALTPQSVIEISKAEDNLGIA